MIRTLLNETYRLCAAGTLAVCALSAVAGPSELHTSIRKNNPPVHSNQYAIVSATNFANSEVSVTANAIEFHSGYKNRKSLCFEIIDATTSVRIAYKDADGIGAGDRFELTHRFKNGERLFISIDYRGEENYAIDSRIVDSNNRTIVGRDICTAELNPIMRKIVQIKTQPVVQWGRRQYDELVTAISAGKKPALPYEDLRRALTEVEHALPMLKKQEKAGSKALSRIGSEYLALTKRRVAQ